MWAVLCSLLVVAVTAMLGRATINLKAALTDKPDIAVYVLLPDEEIRHVTLLRSAFNDTRRDYLAETREGMKLVKLQKRNGVWSVREVQRLRE